MIVSRCTERLWKWKKKMFSIFEQYLECHIADCWYIWILWHFAEGNKINVKSLLTRHDTTFYILHHKSHIFLLKNLPIISINKNIVPRPSATNYSLSHVAAVMALLHSCNSIKSISKNYSLLWLLQRSYIQFQLLEVKLSVKL